MTDPPGAVCVLYEQWEMGTWVQVKLLWGSGACTQEEGRRRASKLTWWVSQRNRCQIATASTLVPECRQAGKDLQGRIGRTEEVGKQISETNTGDKEKGWAVNDSKVLKLVVWECTINKTLISKINCWCKEHEFGYIMSFSMRFNLLKPGITFIHT